MLPAEHLAYDPYLILYLLSDYIKGVLRQPSHCCWAVLLLLSWCMCQCCDLWQLRWPLLTEYLSTSSSHAF
jgi:hypothetical protein